MRIQRSWSQKLPGSQAVARKKNRQEVVTLRIGPDSIDFQYWLARWCPWKKVFFFLSGISCFVDDAITWVFWGSAKIDCQVSLKLHRMANLKVPEESDVRGGTGWCSSSWATSFGCPCSRPEWLVTLHFWSLMTILDRRPCHRPMIQAHFGFSCAWIMFVGNKGEVELCNVYWSHRAK